jgi:hypothetical protein
LSSPNAVVRTQDLEAVLDYLQGLQLILSGFHAEERGRADDDPILSQLQEMDCLSAQNWDALRYQTGVGQGWQYVAETVGELRTRMLDGYANAAL